MLPTTRSNAGRQKGFCGFWDIWFIFFVISDVGNVDRHTNIYAEGGSRTVYASPKWGVGHQAIVTWQIWIVATICNWFAL